MTIKKIIAREGLIILGIVAIGYFVFAIPSLFIKPKPIRIEKIYDKKQPIDLFTEKRIEDKTTRKIYRISEVEKITGKQEMFKEIGFTILLLGYPLYLLIRFIIWAIKILHKKE